MMRKKIVIIGYSGHAYVAIDIFHSMAIEVNYYVDKEEKTLNPFSLIYKGNEIDSLDFLKSTVSFVAIGDNAVRSKVVKFFQENQVSLVDAIHSRANVSSFAVLKKNVMIGAGACVNSFAVLSDGVIVNTGAIVDHECQIEEFAHIAPGAVLAGNVQVGARTFVGANSVVKQGIKIGKDVVIGAGTVVVKDVPDNVVVAGNPQKILYGK